MLKIRQAQLDALAEAADERFVREMAEHVRVSLTPPLDAAAVETLVRDAIARAAAWGLVGRNVIGAFVLLLFEAGPRADDHPAIRALLADDSRPPAERLRAVLALDHTVWNDIAPLGPA